MRQNLRVRHWSAGDNEGLRAPRRPNYRQALINASNQITAENFAARSDEDRLCSICASDLDDFSALSTLALECSDHHIFHMSCLESWCKANFPGEAFCPLCRTNIPIAQPLLDQLKFGVTGKAYT